jgi:hypothetical protein
MTTQAIDIPYLGAEQSVEEWRKTYMAATALLDGPQKLQLFPLYAGKYADHGEKQMIEYCAKLEDIKKALDEFETFRDGEPHLIQIKQKLIKQKLNFIAIQ